MKYAAIFGLVLLLACGCHHNDLMTSLLHEQQTLKDSANAITGKIEHDIHQGINDSSIDLKKQQLSAVHIRLTAIQASLDSLALKK